MFIEKEYLESHFKRIMERFDHLESILSKSHKKERPTINGETVLDNQDLCLLLNCSKRTLQYYRSEKMLPYYKIKRKTYYMQSEVETFITENFEQKLKCNNNNT
jgi:predicted lipase